MLHCLAAAADADHEILEDAHASLAVAHLGMELQAPDASLPVAQRRGDAAVRGGEDLEARARRFAIESPWLIQVENSGGRPGEQLVGRSRWMAPMAMRTVLRPYSRSPSRSDLAAEVEGHALDAVADAEDGQPRSIDRGVGPRRAGLVGAPRASPTARCP